MTEIKRRTGIGGALPLCLWLLFLIFLLLKNPSVASACIEHALSLCTHTLLPSLFPFAVLSELLIRCGFGEIFGAKFGRPIAFLFGITRASASVLALGYLCGFPVGARMALELYDTGRISKKECERLLGFANLPSAPFLISAVGASLYQNRGFGILLWCAALVSTITIGLVTRKKGTSQNEVPPLTLPPLNASLFPAAIKKATVTMLSITSYLLFFGTLVGCLSHALSSLSLPPAISAFLYVFFEISSGVSAAASLPVPLLSILFCALAVGWSGLSIHCQLASLCEGRDLSLRFYFRARVAEALLCAAITMIFAPLCF